MHVDSETSMRTAMHVHAYFMKLPMQSCTCEMLLKAVSPPYQCQENSISSVIVLEILLFICTRGRRFVFIVHRWPGGVLATFYWVKEVCESYPGSRLSLKAD